MPNAIAIPHRSSPERKSQILIAVMGLTGSGKSTFINLASGSDLRVGHSVVSCTRTVDAAEPFYLDGREIILYDTPGFNDTNLSETQVLRIIAGELEQQYRNKRTLHGIIYMHRISDIRVGGVQKANFSLFRKLCGDKSLRNVVIVTNMWSLLGSKEDGDRRVREIETMDGFFKPALTKDARLMHHKEETVESAHNILRSILKNHPVPLDVQRELVDENRPIDETSAGVEVDRKLAKLTAIYEQKLKEQMEASREAQKERDEETKQELHEEVQKTKEAIAKLEAERKNQAKEYERFRNQLAETELKRQREVERLRMAQKAKEVNAKIETSRLKKQLAEMEEMRQREAERFEEAQKIQDANAKIEAQRVREQLAQMEEKQKCDTERFEAAQKAKDANAKFEGEKLRKQLAQMEGKQKRESERLKAAQKASAKVESDRLRKKLVEMEEMQKREAERRQAAQKTKVANVKVEVEKLRKQLAEIEGKQRREARRRQEEQKAKDAKARVETDRLRGQLANLKEKRTREAEAHALRIIKGSVKSGRLHTIRGSMTKNYQGVNDKKHGDALVGYDTYRRRPQEQWIIAQHGENWKIQSAYNRRHLWFGVHGVYVSAEPHAFTLAPTNKQNEFWVKDVKSGRGWEDPMIIECRN